MINLYHKNLLIALTAALVLSSLSTAWADPLFTPYTAIPTGSWPEATAIGDVNGDGLNDVVLTTSYYADPENDYKLFVFLQDDSGQLQAPIKYSTQGTYTNRPLSVDIGDVNGDGRSDVVVGNSKFSIQIFLQDANGDLTPSSIYPTQNSTVIKIGDLNGDGLLDVAGIGHGTSTASVLYQNGDGTLAPPVSFNAPHGGFDDMDIGDINDDGKNDLVVMSGQGYAYDNLAILTQNAGGSFDPVVFYDLGFDVNTSGLGVGDIDGDNRNDVVVSYGGNSPASNIGFFLQDAGGLAPAISYSSYDIPETVEVKDVTGDGLSDVVVLHGGWYRMGVYSQTSDGGLNPEELYAIPYASHYNKQGLKLGDINGDGHPDAVIADYNNGLVVLHHESETANNPPIADAGPDQSLQLNEGPLPVWLDGGNSSDPDNDQLSFDWTLTRPSGSSAALDNRTDVKPGFTADVAGTYIASLRVYDGKAYSAIDSVTITVAAANLPPIADAGQDMTVQQNTAVGLDGSQSNDPDGQIVAWNWRQIGGPTVILNNDTGPTASFIAPKLKGQKNLILSFELTVTDNDGATTVDRIYIDVVR
ncbi:MAG: FG-GAP-like repeat-containing protein [Gammaproteobacteria bacterium]